MKFIFDNDGVLSDTLSDSYAADCKVFEELGTFVPSLDEYRKALLVTNWDSFYQSFGIKNVENAVKLYYDVLSPTPKAIPGVIDALASLKSSKAIVSKYSDYDGLLLRLDQAGILKFFDERHIHAVEKSKVEAIQFESLTDACSYYIGDTVDDIKDAKIAGVRPISISANTSYCLYEDLNKYKPCAIFSHIKELKKYESN